MSGPYEMRRVRAMAAPRLDVRATTAKAKFSQPTNVVALTSTFTPPTSCFEDILSMVPPSSFIWNNEPVPVANFTVAACYPPEFLESYTSVNTTNSGGTVVASSIVPAMSPFVCPKNHCTMFAESRNYIACCPSGYQFHPPDTTVDTDRPAYGGTCYSDLPIKTNVPVVKFDNDGGTASGAFSSSASGAQAFAHPIDGWALTSPTGVGCPTSSASSSDNAADTSGDGSSRRSSSNVSAESGTGASSSTPSAAASSSNSTSTGAIVGATIGGCVALAAIIALVWFVLRRHKNANAIPKDAHQVADDFGGPKTYYRSEAPAAYPPATYSAHEIGAYPHEKAAYNPSQLNDGHGAFEMQAVSAAELPAGSYGKPGGDAKVVDFHAR